MVALSRFLSVNHTWDIIIALDFGSIVSFDSACLGSDTASSQGFPWVVVAGFTGHAGHARPWEISSTPFSFSS